MLMNPPCNRSEEYADDLFERLLDSSIVPDLPYEEWVENFLFIKTKEDKIVKFKRNDLQQHFYQACLDSNKNFHLLIKYRQPGASTEIQARIIYESVTDTMSCMTIGCDDENTTKLRRISGRFFDNLPEEWGLRKSTDNAKLTVYHPSESEIMIGTAGGRKMGRGGTCRFVHGSEVAHWPHPEITIAGALQALAPGGTCIFETTANGAQGWVWDIVNNPGKWQIHFYAWWWTEEYQITLEPGEVLIYTEDELQCIAIAKADGFNLTPEQINWRRDKQHEVGILFQQEYPATIKEAFIISGESVFDNYNRAITGVIVPYNSAHFYTAGIDWGQQDDFTVISVWDVMDEREVYLERWNKMDYDSMIERIVNVCIEYKITRIEPEANAMAMQVSKLRDLIEDALLEYNGDKLEPGWKSPEEGEWECKIFAVTMTNKAKRLLVNRLYRGIHYEDVILLDIAYATAEMSTFVKTQTSGGEYRYDHIKGGKSDTVIARMLGWNAALRIRER